ncbi:hypothetical protein [Sandarakinorhabdus sp.]|uniref:hypothetical protein n=1 Tax=Sandarakinorhabdus sp. TaxID=1916663 RepID=UPI00286E615F|nr:hypothetical protein [Sandarakinorhabdus sp.]
MPNNSQIVLAKIEGTYGVDSAPVPATDAQIIYDWEPQPMQFDEIRRRIDRGFAGRRPKVKTRGRQGHGFRFELAGSGTANIATRWGSVWLRACMFGAPVPNGAIDVSYPLETVGDGSSLTLYGHKGDAGTGYVRMRTQGLRSNLILNFTEGDFPYGAMDGIGLLNQVPDGTAIGAPTLPAPPAPVEVNSVNTTFTLGGFALLLRSFELNLGMKTSYRSLVGQRAVIFDTAEDGDRRSAGGTIVAELPDPSVRNYFTEVTTRADLALSLVHGTVAGNILDLTSARLQIDEPTFSVEQNRLMMTCNYDLIPSAAGNELVLKTR